MNTVFTRIDAAALINLYSSRRGVKSGAAFIRGRRLKKNSRCRAALIRDTKKGKIFVLKKIKFQIITPV